MAQLNPIVDILSEDTGSLAIIGKKIICQVNI